MNNPLKYQTAIDEQTREELTLDSYRGLGYRADRYDLHSFPASSCAWHWHNEVEVFYMEQGALIYRTPNRELRFDEGDAGFVNADILHMTEAAGCPPSIQQYHIFSPQMLACPLNNVIESHYLDPLTHNHTADVMRFPAASEQAVVLRTCMDRAFELHSKHPFGFEIYLRNTLSELWLLLLENMPKTEDVPATRDLERVRSMVQYIEKHYAERISLDAITNAAHIGKGEGSRCFKRMLHMTIFDFLISYRIDRAKNMLSHSPDSITRISLKCGFPSTNYFDKVFREKTKMTPSEYRFKYSNSIQSDNVNNINYQYG